jgi:ABC-type multidrug transport system fused ATPase/permease subunit
VSAAEDLRDLESLKTVLSTPTAGPSGRMSENIAEIHQTTLYNDRNDFIGRNSDDSVNLNVEKTIRIPKVYRQYGGRLAWQSAPPRMDIKNLFFTYPSVGIVDADIDGVGRPILNNISFSIPPGGYSLGIVGPSGDRNGCMNSVI